MLGLVERAADLGERQHHAGRGLVVDGEHGLDLVALVGGEALAELGELQSLAPIGADDLDLEAERLGQFLEAQRKVTGLDHQHQIAGREQVGDRRLPGAMAGRGVEEDLLVGLQDALHAAVAGTVDLEELRGEEVHHRPVHRPQHAVGDVGRARIVEELASARLGVHLSGQWRLRGAKSGARLAASPWRSKRGLRCSAH